MADDSITLHDLLLRDWGTDLPISGGWGQTRDDPIIVTASDADSVALAQWSTLRGLGRGRGIFWRSIARAVLGDDCPGIEQFKIETVQLTSTEIITQTENYYFDVSAMMPAAAGPRNLSALVHRDASGLSFPYEIGWMHFDHAENNEPSAPGLGVTLDYQAPGMKCSVYVYDRGRRGISDDVNDRVVREEFDAAQSDIATVHPDFAPWPEQRRRQDCLERYYEVGPDGRQASLLALTSYRGRFIKARMTWFRDPLIDRLANEFVDALVAIARGGRGDKPPTAQLH